MGRKFFAQRWFFSLTLIFGLLFFLGALVTVFKGIGKIINEITIERVPYLILGMLFDFILNPAGWIGIILLFFAYRKWKRIRQLELE